MAKFLAEECKFKVTKMQEINDENNIETQFNSINETLKENKSNNKKTAVFIYYSGHGLLVDGFTNGITKNGIWFPLEEKARKMSLFKNSLVMCLFDCCRQIPPKKEKGIPDDTTGQLHILHAVGPGKSAITRAEVHGLSEFTEEFLQIMNKAKDPYPKCLKSWLKYHKKAEPIDKTQYFFGLKVDSVSSIVEWEKPTKPFDDWNCFEIADWFHTLKLSKDYSQNVIDKGIDGSMILLMMEEDQEWIECEITLHSDKAKIKKGCRQAILY